MNFILHSPLLSAMFFQSISIKLFKVLTSLYFDLFVYNSIHIVWLTKLQLVYGLKVKVRDNFASVSNKMIWPEMQTMWFSELFCIMGYLVISTSKVLFHQFLSRVTFSTFTFGSHNQILYNEVSLEWEQWHHDWAKLKKLTQFFYRVICDYPLEWIYMLFPSKDPCWNEVTRSQIFPDMYVSINNWLFICISRFLVALNHHLFGITYNEE